MKKIFLILIIAVVFTACDKTDPTADLGMNDELTLKKAEKSMAIDFNGPHFELNLLGKADGWNDKEVDNPERHTMFIPRETAGWQIDLNTPNKQEMTSLPGIRIDMSQGEEFAVLDGTVFDGDPCAFQLGSGKYAVFIAMRGKKNVDPAYVASWLEALETTTVDGTITEELWYYQKLGEVTVNRKWTNITDMFTITSTEAGDLPWYGDEGTNGDIPADWMIDGAVWIFEYMNWLGMQTLTYTDPDTGITTEITYSELAYFWQLQNNGSQLIKVRFYPI